MFRTYSILARASALFLALAMVACAPYFHQPFKTEQARLGAEAEISNELRSLPEPPPERIVVAVYKFRDQTGQYKPTTNGSSFSTAITQGGTSILLRALEESRWFNPIERENLGNLLNERKIIRSTRAEYTEMTGQKQPNLPSLLFAGLILEGGIVSYDANMITGGGGLRYFGAGASGQYRQDRVTVYLRAISTSTGEVLKTVYTTKTILSQQVDASLFQFVSFKKLLETETGFTYNEPTEMAVKEAIEKAVQSLVYEGIVDNLWRPRNPADRNGPAVTSYLQEKTENRNIDVLGRLQYERRAHLGVGISAASAQYRGDRRDPAIRSSGELRLQWNPNLRSKTSFEARLGQFEIGAGELYREKFSYIEAAGLYRFFPQDRFTPYLTAGAGATLRNSAATGLARTLAHTTVGLGIETMLGEKASLSISGDNHYYLSDKLDRVQNGRYYDFYWSARLGLTYYFRKSAKAQHP
jgi:curli production assembly/transport component CsgG